MNANGSISQVLVILFHLNLLSFNMLPPLLRGRVQDGYPGTDPQAPERLLIVTLLPPP
jgi:hypothetical protein